MSSTDALKKPQTAYFLWMNANREKVQKEAGTKDIKIVAAKASELWKSATSAEKGPFEKEAARQKEAYDKFVATEEGQKALQEKKAEKKEEKQAKQDKEAEKAKLKEEKQIAKEKKECKAAVKAVAKDDKLKKPMTAYFAWLNDNRERITKLLGGKGGSEVAKKGSEMWKTLPEKEKSVYESKAKKEKEEYDAYIATPEGAAALKAYKAATAAVAFKEKVVDEGKEAAAQKRKIVDAGDVTDASKKRQKIVAAGA